MIRQENGIQAAEERLREAMLCGDIATLDALISDDLLFTSPEGNLITKEMDLEGHRSGAMKLFTMVPSEQHVREFDDVAIVSVKMALTGLYGGNPLAVDMRYLRVWKKLNGSWQIVAGHCIPVLAGA